MPSRSSPPNQDPSDRPRPAGQWQPSAPTATLVYVLAAVAMTWPLASQLTSSIAWDLGDSLLNCWILAWDAEHYLKLLRGDFASLGEFWHGNIFHPAKYALGYSEHLIAQAIQILPVYAATKNIILSYNVLFLSTFVLSGLGMFLLVRELTASAMAALVAGLIYAFTPYRIGQFSHVQVLSSQWMPFALYGLRKYFDSRQSRDGSGAKAGRYLWGAAAALVAQNLSCGYFLFYFPPFVAAYCLYEMADRGLIRARRVWLALIATGAGVLVLTLPFVRPYLALRELGLPPRPVGEVEQFSADVYSYLTAHGAQMIWGEIMRAYPKPEGDLFPSVVPVLLALAAVFWSVSELWRQHRSNAPPAGSPRWIERIAAFVALFYGLGIVFIVATGGLNTTIGPVPLRFMGISRTIRFAAVGAIVLLIVSPRARAMARGVSGSAFAFFVAATVGAWWLSLGPTLKSKGQVLTADGPYRLLFNFVPGFDGLRVPARYGMLVMMFLSVVAGYGVARLHRSVRGGVIVCTVLAMLFLFESTSAPIFMNGNWEETDIATPPPKVFTGAEVPEVYRYLATLPDGVVVAEFPFGSEQYELRYLYYSTFHWRKLLNGYSGGFPPEYLRLKGALRNMMTNLDRAWTVLSPTGATHAVVHEDAFRNQDGRTVSDWLERHGGRLVASFGSDKVFELPAR